MSWFDSLFGDEDLEDLWDPNSLRSEGFGNEDFSPDFWDAIGGLGKTAVTGLVGAFKKPDGTVDWGRIGSFAGGVSGLLGLNDPRVEKVGYTGGIPKYTAVREQVPMAQDPNRRPGSGGRRYFSDITYAKTGAPERPSLEAARQMATAQAQQLAGSQNPPPQRDEVKPLPLPPEEGMGMATGGIAALAKGRYLGGPSDGMEDKLPASIDGKQAAKLSHGEFVIPADVVSHLGNGNSEAGAKQLYAMMDRIRQARTGTKKQGKQINPKKHLPV